MVQVRGQASVQMEYWRHKAAEAHTRETQSGYGAHQKEKLQEVLMKKLQILPL